MTAPSGRMAHGHRQHLFQNVLQLPHIPALDDERGEEHGVEDGVRKLDEAGDLRGGVLRDVGAADAGSTNRPSFDASSRCAARISSSVTVCASPPESRSAATALRQFTGAPIRIAVAIVSG